jgi:hypothetical protein
MNLTRRQITLLVASMLSFQEQFTPVGEFYQELDELIELLDQEHQKLIGETK